jgi:GT2 family glycosyltransferase/ubiquinone/menaquinone biosynthesis C-methylase UbiE
MKTSIIIWTYNQRGHLQQCIESIRRYTDSEKVELIIIDGHSVDGTREWLKNQPDLISICHDQNLGYLTGCNEGIKIASGDNILLLDNDVTVSHGWLDNLIYCLYSNEQIGAVAPVTNNCAYYQTVAVHYQTMDEMQAYARNHNQPNYRAWEERIKLVGCCMLVKKSVIDVIGLLDESFDPGYLADEDYSFRIRQQGYKLLLCRDTFVHHAGDVHYVKNDNTNYHQLLSINLEKFTAKWGFNPAYSTWIRHDIIGLIENPKAQAIHVLEIGCACGATLLKIKDIYPNASLYGIELNDQAALSAKLFADVIAADIEKTALPYEEGYFDYVILADVLEHLENPWRALENIRTYLKPGGQLLASIPNVMHFSVLRNLLQGNWSYEEAGILDKTHLRFFTLNEIKKMFTGAGYTVNNCRPNYIYESIGDQQFTSILASLAGNDQLKEQFRAYQYVITAGNPAAAVPAPRQEQLQANKICFITCENDDILHQQFLAHIASLEIPDGYEVEVLSIKDSVSMASAYNQAIGKSNAKYKVYLHPDVFIIHKQFIQEILTVFANPQIGVIGVVGSSQLPANGIWWESSCCYGKVYDSHSGTMGLVAFREVDQSCQDVQCVDGLMMVTQYDLPWREDLFTGWYFYDLAQSMEFIRSGYRIVVPRQQQPWCMHNCGVVNLGNGYEVYRQVFVNHYLQELQSKS